MSGYEELLSVKKNEHFDFLIAISTVGFTSVAIYTFIYIWPIIQPNCGSSIATAEAS